METYELKVDVNTPYIKTLRFLGVFLIGFTIATIIFSLKYEGFLDWVNIISLIAWSLFFTFFPGIAKKQVLTVDEEGIHLLYFVFHRRKTKEVKWEQVKAVGLGRNGVEIKNRFGSTNKIRLPFHTKNQLRELNRYLYNVSKVKKIEYLG